MPCCVVFDVDYAVLTDLLCTPSHDIADVLIEYAWFDELRGEHSAHVMEMFLTAAITAYIEYVYAGG